MPQSAAADSVVSLELAVQLLRLPVPDKQLPIGIARHQIAAATSRTNRLQLRG